MRLKSSTLRVVSACSRCPKAVLFRLAKCLLEALLAPRCGKISSDIMLCRKKFRIIIFLNRLKIIENTKKKPLEHQNKTSMVKAMVPSEIHRPFLGSSDPGPM
jgi:hypothetical protein